MQKLIYLSFRKLLVVKYWKKYYENYFRLKYVDNLLLLATSRVKIEIRPIYSLKDILNSAK